LLRDAKRVAWAAQLHLQHGICLKEAGKLGEARGVLAGVVQRFADRPEAAEAELRIGQCLLEEPLKRTENARRVLTAADAKAEDVVAALRSMEDDVKALRNAVTELETQAEALKKKRPEAEARARMLYDAAWGWRILADVANAVARNRDPREVPPAEKQA